MIRETSQTFVKIKKASKYTNTEIRKTSMCVKAEGT